MYRNLHQKLGLLILVMFLIMTDVALGAVGGGSVSDGTSAIQPDLGYSTGTAAGAGIEDSAQSPSMTPMGMASSMGAYVPVQTESYQPIPSESSSPMSGSYPEGYSQLQGYVPPSAVQNAQTVVSSAPQISGPYQEGMSAEDLKFARPQADSFRPDESLGFVSAALPSNLNIPITGANAAYSTASGAMQGTAPGSSSWYYPSSVRSPNRFYVQTSSGLSTVGGCGYGSYLPLWADINSGGNFFVYEWYPGRSTPSAQWWGWSWTGYKKGWFYGDVPGWHVLVYNCRYWSNYIYIYVYPSSSYPGAYAGTAYSGAAMATQAPYSAGTGASFGYGGSAGMGSALPGGAPTPPNPGSESLALPDSNIYMPYTSQAMQTAFSGNPAQSGLAAPAGLQSVQPLPGLPSGYSSAGTMSAPAVSGYGYSARPCTACIGSTMAAGGVSSSYPSEGNCPTCASAGLTAPRGYAPQSYQAVYPRPSTCRCNEYYVQYYPNRISTVAGVYCGEWLPLWSKISRPGVYWSYEWTLSGSAYGSPEVRNFGYKNAGWYQTWFSSSDAGWHVLSYHCNDWSNYIYIYVWPTS